LIRNIRFNGNTDNVIFLRKTVQKIGFNFGKVLFIE